MKKLMVNIYRTHHRYDTYKTVTKYLSGMWVWGNSPDNVTVGLYTYRTTWKSLHEKLKGWVWKTWAFMILGVSNKIFCRVELWEMWHPAFVEQLPYWRRVYRCPCCIDLEHSCFCASLNSSPALWMLTAQSLDEAFKT